jgi:transketolase
MTTEYKNSQSWQVEARRVAHGIRRRVLELTLERNGGYLSQACSAAEIIATLYTRVLNIGPSLAPRIPPPLTGVPSKEFHHLMITGAKYNGPKEPNLDRFLLSPAHYAIVIYAALVETGRMDPEGLAQLNVEGSTAEMIGAEYSPGIELTTGSLGQGLSQACGIAMARRLRGETGRVVMFMSDGELEEGQTWEAIQALAFFKMDNVIVYVDVNGQQVDGLTKNVMNVEPIQSKIDAFGARVVVVNGHSVDELVSPATLSPCGKPLFVLAYTNPCEGISLLNELEPGTFHLVRFTDDAEWERYRSYLQLMQREGGGSSGNSA